MERTMQTTRRYKRTRQPRRIVLLWLVCLFAAVSFGVLLGLIPIWMPVLLLAAFYLGFSLIIIIQPHFFRSVITFLLFFAGVLCTVPMESIVAGCLGISLIVIRRHLVRYQGEKLKIRILGLVR